MPSKFEIASRPLPLYLPATSPNSHSISMGTSPSKAITETNFTSRSPTRITKLDKDWEKRLEELRQYKKDHGNTSVPASSNRFQTLGKWCEYQRARYDGGKLSRDRIDRLKEVGFVFEGNVPRSPEKKFPAYEELWKKRIRDLKKFKEEFGHAKVPPRYAVNRELGKWVSSTNIRCLSIVHAIHLFILSSNIAG